MKKLTVVIIDSGIDITKSDLSKYVKTSMDFQLCNGVIMKKEEMEVKHKHGTAISMIIRDICEQVEFISLNILNEKLVGDGRVLIHSLKEALNYNPDIIHLSLGTTKWRYIIKLKGVIKKALNKDILIVAAVNNNYTTTFPACFKGIIGVKTDKFLDINVCNYKNGYFFSNDNAKLIKGISEICEEVNIGGNSMAAAFVTGYIAKKKLTSKLVSKKDFIKCLKKENCNE